MNSLRIAIGLTVLVSGLAAAEAPLVTSRSLQPAGRVFSVWGSSRGVGIGAVLPWGDDPSRHLGVEAQWNSFERSGEIRAAWTFGLKTEGLLTMTAFAGPTLTLVPVGAFDFGLSPQAGFFAGLGGEHWRVDLGLETGMDVFLLTGVPRFPERAVLALQTVFEKFTVGALFRAGVDLEPGRYTVGRVELALSIGFRPPDRTSTAAEDAPAAPANAPEATPTTPESSTPPAAPAPAEMAPAPAATEPPPVAPPPAPPAPPPAAPK